MKKSYLIGTVAICILSGVGCFYLNSIMVVPLVDSNEKSELQGSVLHKKNTTHIEKIIVEERALSLVDMKEAPLVDEIMVVNGITLRSSSIDSMRKARIDGDPRAPKLIEASALRVLPTEEELGDHALYLEYEAKQKQDLLKSFVGASSKKVTELEKLLAEDKELGVSEADLVQGYEKVEKLKEMNARLLDESPDLLNETGK